MNAHALRYSLLAAFVVIALAACGGAASPARAPEGLAEPEPTTVEEAQQQIARAQSRLAGGASKAADPPAAASEAAPSLEPAPATPSSEPGARPDSMTKQGAGNGPCPSSCRALVSMRRAVTALCRMTGVADARCVDAKRTLTGNEGRVTPCNC